MGTTSRSSTTTAEPWPTRRPPHLADQPFQTVARDRPRRPVRLIDARARSQSAEGSCPSCCSTAPVDADHLRRCPASMPAARRAARACATQPIRPRSRRHHGPTRGRRWSTAAARAEPSPHRSRSRCPQAFRSSPTRARPRRRDGPRRRAADRHPAPARPQQSRHHLGLPARASTTPRPSMAAAR